MGLYIIKERRNEEDRNPLKVDIEWKEVKLPTTNSKGNHSQTPVVLESQEQRNFYRLK